jgi:hypothetical protein
VRHLSLLPLALATLLLSGCVVGRTYRFDHTPNPSENIGQGRTVLLFAVKDARPEVTTDGEPLSYVGEQRSGYGIPYTVKTTSGRPMAAVVQEALEGDLRAAGFAVVAVREVGPETPGGIEGFLTRNGATRGLAVTMDELDSDTYSDIDVEWNLEIAVFGPDGRTLARDRQQGKRELQGSFMNPVGAAKREVPAFVYRTLIPSLVLENEVIRAALVSEVKAEGDGDAGREKEGCTVEQVLKMKEAGLSDEQVRAACGEGKD